MSLTNRVSFREESFGFGVDETLGEELFRFGIAEALYTHNQPDGGRITVMNRMTGFGFRDVETGYTSPCEKCLRIFAPHCRRPSQTNPGRVI